MKAHGFNNYVCKSEEKLLERLDQPLLDVIDNPQKTQQTTAIGRYFDKRSTMGSICCRQLHGIQHGPETGIIFTC